MTVAGSAGRRAVFPGSFDPLTTAHLAVADAVRRELDAVRVDLVVSHRPLAKEDRDQAPVEHRLAAIEEAAKGRPWLGVGSTSARLLVDIASGYDLLIMGADKWHQLHDVAFYADTADRDAAIARLPRLVVVPRGDIAMPADAAHHVLSIPSGFRHVSSSAVRAGRTEWRA